MLALPMAEHVNKQPPEKRIVRTDGALEVVEVFATIQGEGPFAGRPSIFVRTAGCNLRCPACDTDYTTGRTLYTIEQLVAEVQRVETKAGMMGTSLVVLTGGEPFRQACGPFIRALLADGYRVQVETNGTLRDSSLPAFSWLVSMGGLSIVCSPKAGINEELKPWIDALKYVIRAEQVDPVDGLPTSSLLSEAVPGKPWPGFRGTTYVQPCDEQDVVKNKANTDAAIVSCMKFGYTLCLQMHKIVGLP